MGIKVHCRCGRQYQVKDVLAGRLIKCPSCRAVIRVAKPAQARPGQGDIDPFRAAIDEDLGGEHGSVAQHRCRACQAIVDVYADLCPHCGAIFQGHSVSTPEPAGGAPPPAAAAARKGLRRRLAGRSVYLGDWSGIGRIIAGIVGVLAIIGAFSLLGSLANAETRRALAFSCGPFPGLFAAWIVGGLLGGLCLLGRAFCPGIGFTRAMYSYLGGSWIGGGLVYLCFPAAERLWQVSAVMIPLGAAALGFGLRPKGRILDLILLLPLLLIVAVFIALLLVDPSSIPDLIFISMNRYRQV